MHPNQLRLGVAVSIAMVALAAALPTWAGEAERHSQIIERLAPQDRLAYLRQLVDQQQARAGASLAADVTGPSLLAFNAASAINLGKSAAPFKVYAKMSDDLSGASTMYFYATGPSGQTAYVYAPSSFPAPTLSANLGFSPLNRMMEPGVWKFEYGYGYDGADNYSVFDEAALEALGNTVFTVTNNGGYDTTQPQLIDGKVLTPSVSLASVLPGTTNKPTSAGVKVNLTDAGNTALAGVKSVTLYFCKLADPNKCIYPSASVYATGQASAALTAGTEVSAANGIATGTYELRHVYVYDHAGNYSALYGTKFGGSTDFSTLFPGGTVIKVKP